MIGVRTGVAICGQECGRDQLEEAWTGVLDKLLEERDLGQLLSRSDLVGTAGRHVVRRAVRCRGRERPTPQRHHVVHRRK